MLCVVGIIFLSCDSWGFRFVFVVVFEIWEVFVIGVGFGGVFVMSCGSV